jgi:TPR repeat protein
MLRLCLTSVLSLLLMSCATTHGRSADTEPKLGLSAQSHLQQGKRFFEDGFYKRAMQELLPVATEGSAEAQYAVGYMYYYGYGVAQDTDVGYFWIQRSAGQHYYPAMQALQTMQQKKQHKIQRKIHQSRDR